jgi:hypothetical protein
VPHPTFADTDDEDFIDDYDDDGFEDDYLDDEGAMFDTTIVRDNSKADPRSLE